LDFPEVSDLVLQRDGKILVAGTFLRIDGTAQPYMGRLFGGEPAGPPSIAVAPADRLAMAEQTIQLSVVATGTPPPTYQWMFDRTPIPGATNSAFVLPSLSTTNAGQYSVIVSNSFGSLETTPATLTVLPVSTPEILVQPVGTNVIEGGLVSFSITATNFLPIQYQWRLNGTNLLDQTNAVLSLPNATLSNAGRYSAVLTTEVRTVTTADALLEVSPSHSVDPVFFLPRLPGDFDVRAIAKMAVQPDGKIIVVGDFVELGGAHRNRIARLNTDGSIDQMFDPGEGVGGGYFTGSPLNMTYLDIQAVALQSDGKILIGGRFTVVDSTNYAGVARLNSDGTLDTAFAAFGVTEGPDFFQFSVPNLAYVSSIVVQPDNKILIVGPFRKVNGVARNCLARLEANGTVDTGFDPGIGLLPAPGELLSNVSFDLALALNGDIIAKGQIGLAYRADIPRRGIARFKTGGELDMGFAPSIDPSYWSSSEWLVNPSSLAVASDGKVILSGSFNTINGKPTHQIARLNADGTLDSSFAPQLQPDLPVKVLLQSDGRILIYGSFTNVSGIPRPEVARLNSDGSADLSFNPGQGPDDGRGSISSVALTPAGEIVVAGIFTMFDTAARDSIALLYSQDAEIPSFIGSWLSDGEFHCWVRSWPGKTYDVEASPTLAAPHWTVVETLTGDGTPMEISAPADSNQHFYRVQVR
jgi:uncharacterized delta-60 repeat protein